MKAKSRVTSATVKHLILLAALTIVGASILSSGLAQAAGTQEPVAILKLTIPSTARVVDHDDGIYVVGTSSGDLYVINEAGDYTVTQLGAGRINDVRIENAFIAVAAYRHVIELELVSLLDLTPTELWRTTLSGWSEVVSTDLSEDGDYVCYLAQRNEYYTNAGEVGVFGGGAGGGSLISRLYASGWVLCNWWIDATGDMEYIAASQPMGGCCYKVGVALYQFDGSTLTMNWWKHLIPKYETTEVRVSENKDYVAVATSSGTYMKLLRISDGAILGSYVTPGKEQYACDGDDSLNYVIGATRAWSSPYPWFVLRNLGTSYEALAQGTMVGRISDLDANHDASLLAFGSNQGEFLLLSRSNSSIDTVFSATVDSVSRLIDAIEIGSHTLLVGGYEFIHLYGLLYPIAVDIKPQSCPNPFNARPRGVLPVAILGSADFQVSDVDTASILLEGVPPWRWYLEDVSTPVYPGEDTCECTTDTGDGHMDMTLKFSQQAILDALEPVNDGEVRVLTLTGMTWDGMAIEGHDCVFIIKKRAVSIFDGSGPVLVSLHGNHPNPFNPTTSIGFNLSSPSRWSLQIYNTVGQLVKRFDGYSSGEISVRWDGTNHSGAKVSSGIYFYKLSAGDFTATKKMVLTK